ncbi:FHA domain-containing protein [Spirochaeta isovalerica]|uniref:DNA-binding CsgD family transcriptional regulator n=1 Tax=Spirochaeta isovalerica TaxID=150 RepID=A0A841R5U5_9SPIO|nr:FHA domain-containing protein [Spirochaeta isovalerica]MBB6479225.1 DNA-binding CsgD family transcriptional regulator [Spirochaeta isovalerica]
MRDKAEKTQWYLEGETRDKAPWIIPLNENFSIGRLDSSDLILSSGSVSRRHARMNFDGEDLYIQDLNSSNGTFVNGSRIKERSLLRHGDLLKIGQTEFRVSEGMPASGEQEEHTLVGIGDGQLDFSAHYGLSERETEILYFLVKGFNLQDIGDKLFISPGTVKNHVLKIYKKTGSHSRIELATSFREFNS